MGKVPSFTLRLTLVLVVFLLSARQLEASTTYFPPMPIVADVVQKQQLDSSIVSSNPFTKSSTVIIIVNDPTLQSVQKYSRFCVEGRAPSSCQQTLDIPVIVFSTSHFSECTTISSQSPPSSPSASEALLAEHVGPAESSQVDLVLYVPFVVSDNNEGQTEDDSNRTLQLNRCERFIVQTALSRLLSDYGQLIFLPPSAAVPTSVQRLWWLELIDIINRAYYNAFMSMLPGDNLLNSLFITKGILGFRKHPYLREMPPRWNRRIGHNVRLSRRGRSRCGPRTNPPLNLPKVEIDTAVAPLPTARAEASSFDSLAVLQPWATYENLTQTFAGLATSFGSDKAFWHHYDKQYGILFAPFHDFNQPKRIKMIEFGVNQFASMRLWEQLFPKASSIVGVDITYNDSQRGNLKVYGGDQGAPQFLTKLVLNEKDEAFDIVIDDGGHTFWQQQLTYAVLYPRSLKKGGLYVIEDIETSYYRGYPVYNALICGGRGVQSTTIEWAKRMILPVFRGENPEIQSMYFGTNMIGFRKPL